MEFLYYIIIHVPLLNYVLSAIVYTDFSLGTNRRFIVDLLTACNVAISLCCNVAILLCCYCCTLEHFGTC